MSIVSFIRVGLLICAFIHCVTAALAEQVTFPSANVRDMGPFATGEQSGKVEIRADLSFPSKGRGPFPAVVIAHTIGGYFEANEGWFAAELRKAGFATLTYDSFKPRNWTGRFAKADPSVGPSALYDAFAALDFLAGHSNIDQTKIAVIGFSHGGDVAHMAAFERFRRAMMPNRRFAAHVGFYPGWVWGTRAGKDAYSGAPVLLLLADKDELTPAAKVESYLAYLKKDDPAPNIQVVTYRNAYHAWTNVRVKTPRFFPEGANARKCPLLLVGQVRVGMLINGEEKSFDRPLWERCFPESRGYTMGFSAQVRAKSLADTIVFLKRSMSL